ncbi:MAG: M20/M25/M40 family metallo-hydrolase [Alphaproteobacteria bacterium]|nr:M20/M25/M40 family metallo-hydrolase [Alphaproteobacteria bacterium]
MTPPPGLSTIVAGLMPLASEIFDGVRSASRDVDGVTRPAWSKQDQAAADILLAAARGEGLRTRRDAVGNIYMDLPGRDESAPGILSGSHLDSVARGGNFDGLAGAVAGLIAVAAVRRAGMTPLRGLSAMGIRGEESVWYGIAYIGARLAVGGMGRAEFDALARLDTDRPLADHMADLGLPTDDIWRGEASIGPHNTKAFLELHIEQGPLLVEQSTPLAVATAIRGNLRHGDGVCHGAYQHSAATPRRSRQDAVLAVTELLHGLEQFWHRVEDQSDPSAVFTVGKLFTDPDHHALTKVPGECHFSLNFGSTEQGTLDRAAAEIAALTSAIAQRRNVRFTLGDAVGSSPTPLDAELRKQLAGNAARLAIPCGEFATVGHDASIIARAGIPAAVLLVRNADGSHNANEKMAMEDFEHGVQVLAATMADLADA